MVLVAIRVCNVPFEANITGEMTTAWLLTVPQEHEAPMSKHVEAENNGRHFPDTIFKCIFFNENE